MNTRFHVPTKVFASRRSRARQTGADAGGRTLPTPASLSGIDPLLIDPVLGDSPGRSCSYLVRGDRTVLIDPGSANAAPRVLEALKTQRINVDLVLLTHIHADAAAGVGVIAEHFPQARIAAPAGATKRLADPSALVTDMKKVYGERAEKIYGLPDRIDTARITPVADGDQLNLGDRTVEVIATPGHTAAHMSYFDTSTAALFCGDALGVQLPGSRVVRPSTPPWDFSLEDSLASIDKLSEVGAETVYLAHFGAARPGPDEIFQRASDSLERWHRSFLKKREQTDSEEDLSRQFNACVEASLEPIAPSVRRDLEAVSPTQLNLAGLTAEQARLGGRLNDRLSDAA
jgi:glyoxylase-like metal-dependent hydrolase (beta-lactamase superfamily II)